MAHLVQVQNRWVNMDNVWWIEDDPTTNQIKVYFEKSTILAFPKHAAGALLEVMSPPPPPVKKSKAQG